MAKEIPSSKGRARRRKIDDALKVALRAEAGEKCANPGCTNWRQHIHHIKEWSKHYTHDRQHMIAICPGCHDEVHHGRLKVDDETIYRWKDIVRPSRPDYFEMHIEPSSTQRLMLGSICISSKNSRTTLAKVSDNNSLGFRVIKQRFLKVTLSLHTPSGTEILRVTDNIVEVKSSEKVTFEARPGRVQVSVPSSEEYVPAWMIAGMRRCDQSYGMTGQVIALDLEVVRPGLLKVQGFWASADEACVVTDKALCWVTRGVDFPAIIYGYGEQTEFISALDSDTPLFAGIPHTNQSESRA